MAPRRPYLWDTADLYSQEIRRSDRNVDLGLEALIRKELFDKPKEELLVGAIKYGLASKSGVLVRKDPEPGLAVASMRQSSNVMTLRPQFFESWTDPMFRPLPEAGKSLLNWLSRSRAILHETTHRESSIFTTDTSSQSCASAKKEDLLKLPVGRTSMSDRGAYRPHDCL